MAGARHQRGYTYQSQPPHTQQRQGLVQTTSSLGLLESHVTHGSVTSSLLVNELHSGYQSRRGRTESFSYLYIEYNILWGSGRP